MSQVGIDLADVREVFSDPRNTYGGPIPPVLPTDTNLDLNQRTPIKYITIKPSSNSGVTKRDIDDSCTTTQPTTTSTTTTTTTTTGPVDDDECHHCHHRRKWHHHPRYYYNPNPWMDSMYPRYPYDPMMNPVVRDAIAYKCMWDPDSSPGLCHRVFESEIARVNPWYNPWGWGMNWWR